jgi:hypothetical protein
MGERLQLRVHSITFGMYAKLVGTNHSESSAMRWKALRAGMRIRVSDVLDMFASGLDASQILAEMPDLEADDLKACMMFASLQK